MRHRRASGPTLISWLVIAAMSVLSSSNDARDQSISAARLAASVTANRRRPGQAASNQQTWSRQLVCSNSRSSLRSRATVRFVNESRRRQRRTYQRRTCRDRSDTARCRSTAVDRNTAELVKCPAAETPRRSRCRRFRHRSVRARGRTQPSNGRARSDEVAHRHQAFRRVVLRAGADRAASVECRRRHTADAVVSFHGGVLIKTVLPYRCSGPILNPGDRLH